MSLPLLAVRRFAALLFLLPFFSQVSYGGSLTNIDSLNTEFNQGNAPFELWDKIIKHYVWYDIDRADSLSQAGMGLARQKNDEEGILVMYNGQCRVLIGQSKLQEADSLSQVYLKAAKAAGSNEHLYYALIHRSNSKRNRGVHQEELPLLEQNLEAAIALDDQAKIALVHARKADCLRLLNRYDEAKAELDKAVEICPENANNSRLEIKQYRGVLASTLDRQEEAIRIYLEAIDLAKELGNDRLEAIVHSKIARSYMRINKLDEGIDHIKLTIPIRERAKRWQSVATSYGMLGQLYGRQHRYEEAQQAMERALETFRKGGNVMNQALALMNLGQLYAGPLQDRERAMANYGESYDIYASLNDSINMAMVKVNKGILHSALREDEDGIRELEMALALINDRDRPNMLSFVFRNLAEIHARHDRFDDAYRNLALQDSVDDLIMNRDKMAKIEELTTKYQTAEKEKELLTKEQENDRLTAEKEVAELSYVLAAAGLGLVVLIGLFIWFRQRSLLRQKQSEKELTEMKLTNTRLERQQLESSLKEKIATSEQKALRAQMNPHFIFNTLNSIQLLIANNDQMLAMENVSKFAGLIRKILHNSGKSLISLSDEIFTLELYLEMENVRLKDRLTYSIDVSGELQAEMIEVPPLVYQPFVENAIWHGIMNKPEKSGHIDIRFEGVDGGIRCLITDDGVGITRGMEIKKGLHREAQESLGMKITEERLQLINGTQVPSIQIRERKTEAEEVLGTEVEVFVAAEL